MRKRIEKWFAFALALVTGLSLAALLFAYARPVKSSIYNLSPDWEGEAAPDGWTYDQKGWKVFTQKAETMTMLSPDGYGGFTGLDYPGQTFYFSRTLSEALDSPTLRLEAVNQTLAVFLDGDLLYTDCPELDNRIGYLELPMLERDRPDALMVSLPEDYQRKTMTIAQSTSPRGGEKAEPDGTVWPCPVTLCCSYAYENSLITESFQTAIFGVFVFLPGLALLAVFLRQILRGEGDWSLFCAVVTIFFLLSSKISSASFFYRYFGILPVDPTTLCRDLSLTALLIFLSSRMAGRWQRVVCQAFTLLQGMSILGDTALQLTGNLSLGSVEAKQLIGLAALFAALLCGVPEARRGSRFFRWLCSLVAGGAGLWFFVMLVSPLQRAAVLKQLSLMAFGYFGWRLTNLTLAAALALAAAQAVRDELDRRIEARALTERQKLAQESYEAMRQQNEQIMMLRHDMVKHYHSLRQLTGEAAVAAYLDELIGQNEKICPVIQSGNQMVDIILTSKLNAADAAGIRVEVVRMNSPETLPLSDAELCSVLMNILDNAISAAAAAGGKDPYIRLDLHVKGDFFVISCKNSATREWMDGATGKKNTPGHGLGQKIVRQIVHRRGGLMETEAGTDGYKALLAFPLAQASR